MQHNHDASILKQAVNDSPTEKLGDKKLYFIGLSFVKTKKGKIKSCRFFAWLDPDKNEHQAYFEKKESSVFIAKKLADGGYERPAEISMQKLKSLMFSKNLGVVA